MFPSFNRVLPQTIHVENPIPWLDFSNHWKSMSKESASQQELSITTCVGGTFVKMSKWAAAVGTGRGGHPSMTILPHSSTPVPQKDRVASTLITLQGHWKAPLFMARQYRKIGN